MTIENSISTIRKAIKGSAEGLASRESLEKPEQRHYDHIFNLYKQLRELNPPMLEKVIMIAAKSKDLKEESGPEIGKVFNQVWNEISDGYEDRLEMAVYAGEDDKTQKLSPEIFRQKMYDLMEKFFKEKIIQLKNDPSIVSAFIGKEELLNKYIDLTTSTFLDYLKTLPF